MEERGNALPVCIDQTDLPPNVIRPSPYSAQLEGDLQDRQTRKPGGKLNDASSTNGSLAAVQARPRAERPSAVGNMAPLVLQAVRERSMTTYHEVADVVAANVQQHRDGAASTRRRIYDVMNVLTGAGLIRKEGMAVSIGAEIVPDPRRGTIIARIRRTIQLRCLIERNKRVDLPSFPIDGTLIVVGSDLRVIRGEGHDIGLETDGTSILHPLDLVDRINFSHAEKEPVFNELVANCPFPQLLKAMKMEILAP